MKKKITVFDNAWFFNKTLTHIELRTIAPILAATGEALLDVNGNSINRIVLKSAQNFVLPSFLSRVSENACGGKPDRYLNVFSRSLSVLEFTARFSDRFRATDRDEERSNFINFEELKFEFFFEGLPIYVILDPCCYNSTENRFSRGTPMMYIYILGDRRGDFIDFSGGGQDGVEGHLVGLRDRLTACFADVGLQQPKDRMGEFVGDCDFEWSRFSEILTRLKEVATRESRQVLAHLKFFIPGEVHRDELSRFLDDIEALHQRGLQAGLASQLSFYLWLGCQHANGLRDESGVEHFEKRPDGQPQSELARAEYVRVLGKYLEEFIDWIASVADHETVSGALPAYCLVGDGAAEVGLVVIPVKRRFVLCLAATSPQKEVPLPKKLAAAIGSPDDWVQGVFPVEGDFTLPVLKSKYFYGFGELETPIPDPFVFEDAGVWVKKLKAEFRKKAKGGNTQAKPEAGSLDDQLAQLQAAGLVLSPGITPLDFLLSHSEEFYREEPYVRVCQQLAKRNEEGVVFCPQTISHDEDYPSEEEMMADFQRVCGKEYRIENIEYEFYPEDDEEGEGLKFIRFKANGEDVEWFFGPDAAEERGRYSLLEYFQSFIKERMKDHRLYEIRGVWGTLIFLPKKAAKSIGKLIKLTEAPERD